MVFEYNFSKFAKSIFRKTKAKIPQPLLCIIPCTKLSSMPTLTCVWAVQHEQHNTFWPDLLSFANTKLEPSIDTHSPSTEDITTLTQCSLNFAWPSQCSVTLGSSRLEFLWLPGYSLRSCFKCIIFPSDLVSLCASTMSVTVGIFWLSS